MGEARRRAAAHAAGTSYRPPRVCPKCKGIRIERKTFPPTGLSYRPTDYDLCRDCGTVWEAYPDDWREDVVGAAPCDNCAFRPGSPEQADPKGWRELIGKLRAGGEFRCHKGAPILGLAEGTPEFDAEWVNRRGRTCAGFIRMVWAMRDKGEDWLARHFEFCGAPGYDLPLPNDQGMTGQDRRHLLPRQHIDDLLWSVFHEAESLLRDLEAVEGRGDLATAGRYIEVITTHIEPLRLRVEAVERHERDDALAEDAALARMGPL